MQQATGENVELVYVDQGYTGENAAKAAQSAGRIAWRRLVTWPVISPDAG